MLPQLKIVNALKPAGSAVFIVKDVNGIPAKFISAEEEKFVVKEFKEKRHTVVLNQYKRVLIIHKPEDKKTEHQLLESARKAGDQAAGYLNKNKIGEIFISDENGHADLTLAFAEGMALGSYQFLKYRSEKKEPNTLRTINIKSKRITAENIKNLNAVTEAVFRARDMVNEPQNFKTARQLASAFVGLGKAAGFRVQVLQKQQIKALKMGGLLSVNLGSAEPPTFTVMEYKSRGARNKKPYVLVGKGVVYDTGGLSLKPTPNSMDYMKCDMGGAAVVACAMYAIAKAKLPIHVVALVPSTDNRLSETAYAPGDVITMMSGQTVEVLNTDAEGRLILADALHYAKRYKPELVLDFATLTGAAAAAVGHFGIVCMGTAEDQVKTRIKESGDRVYERLAEFPFWEEYDELLRSDIADMKNIGGPMAGAITAGKFLQRYVDYPWLHFDIAGPAFLHSSWGYRGKNGTGMGVRLLFDFFQNI